MAELSLSSQPLEWSFALQCGLHLALEFVSQFVILCPFDSQHPEPREGPSGNSTPCVHATDLHPLSRSRSGQFLRHTREFSYQCARISHLADELSKMMDSQEICIRAQVLGVQLVSQDARRNNCVHRSRFPFAQALLRRGGRAHLVGQMLRRASLTCRAVSLSARRFSKMKS